MSHSRRQARNRERRRHVRPPQVDGVGYRSALGMLPLIGDPTLRVVFVQLAPELRNAWCRTPGALYRPGLLARLGAGLVAFDARGRCA